MIPVRTVKADLLCVGGGIAGLMAAIRAADNGLKVVVAEKGNTLTSGAGGMGNDHFHCYLPEVHGPDIEPVIEELRRGQQAERLKDTQAVKVWLGQTAEIVRLWESWGIPMKHNGKYVFAGHAFPGATYPCHLKYGGKHQKRVLTEEARKRGVEIINRVMVLDLVSDGKSVFGAVGLSTREYMLFEFRAKAVFLGTGTVARLYPGVTPAWMANATRPCTTTGDGRAMAYRAGAELYNVERLEHHAGPKYFARSGQATWVGVVRNPQGEPVGPYLTRPDARYSDMIIEVNKNLFSEHVQSGKGPVYMDCRGISDEDYEFMVHWMNHEGFNALLDYLKEKDIDLKKHPIEWVTYGMRGSAGNIWQSPKAETSLKGLLVAGDETSLGIAPAATYGWIAGKTASDYAKGTDMPIPEASAILLAEKQAFLEELRVRDGGPDWKEVNVTLQQLMTDYAGRGRTQAMLEAGLTHIKRLKKETMDSMIVRNPHEVMRALETLNLIDLGEVVCVAAMERKETRGGHERMDYPYKDPLLDRQLVVKKVGGKPAAFWR